MLTVSSSEQPCSILGALHTHNHTRIRLEDVGCPLDGARFDSEEGELADLTTGRIDNLRNRMGSPSRSLKNECTLPNGTAKPMEKPCEIASLLSGFIVAWSGTRISLVAQHYVSQTNVSASSFRRNLRES